MAKLPSDTPKESNDKSNPASVINKIIGEQLEGKIEGDDIHAITTRIAQVFTTTYYSGPLPLPLHLKGYEDVLPGSAERILSLTEMTISHSLPDGRQFNLRNRKDRTGMAFQGSDCG